MAAEVTFPTPSGNTAAGYLSAPGEKPQRTPAAVLVLPAWWGLNGFVRRFCDRLAGDGFAALALDLYGGGQVAATIEEATALRNDLDDDAAFDRVCGAVDFLRSRQPDGTPERGGVGVIGFSLGAFWALCLKEHVGAIVAFYGLSDPQSFCADAPVLGHFAEQDEWEPMEAVRAFETALTAAGKQIEVHVYPGTRHWFFEEDRPEYDEGAAEAAYARTIAFLRGR
jgi:carboxymethylenebutenolidase